MVAATPAPYAPGVYATLEDLVAIRHKARGFAFLPRQPVHSLLTGRYGSRLRGRGLDFEELRAYVAGDDVRTIDWKATARTGKPYVRVYTEERDRPVLLVVDQRISMFFGSVRAMKSVVAAEVAALAAWRVLAVGDRIGALVFNDEGLHEVRPHRSERTVHEILDAVLRQNHALAADLEVARAPTRLNDVLERAARMVGHDWLVCIVSDFDGADDRTRSILARTATHSDVLALLVHDPLATRMPSHSRYVVGDGRLQIELDLAGRHVREQVGTFTRDRLARVLAWSGEIGVPVVPIQTVEGPAEQMRRLLGGGPRAARR